MVTKSFRFVAFAAVALVACACSSAAKTAATTSTPAATVAATVAPTVAPVTPAPTAAAVPVLGKPWNQDQEGYGDVRPAVVSNGGDPTGIVRNISWQSWGGAQATGQGTSQYVGPNQAVAQGNQESATIVAFDLGTCGGTYMYQAVEWFFPQHGEQFNPGVYINICTGDYVGQH